MQTLGVFLTPTGDQKEQIKYMRDKAVTRSDKIRAGFLKRDKAWHALQMTIMITLEYPQTVTSLSKQQFDYIMSPVLTSGLPKAGIC
jgi:hypothetical protein